MRFVIHRGVMDGSEVVLDALDAILARVEDEVHEIALTSVDDLDTSAWYASSRRDRRKLLEEIAQSPLHRSPRAQGPHLKTFDVSDEGTARQARGLAYAPLLVLAENDVSDGALVEAALRVLGASLTVDLCFGPPSQIDPPSFQIESRGGHGEIPKLIAKRLEEARSRGRPVRLVVVTDSDGEWPDDVKKHAQDIRDTCSAEGIPCPSLNKRTAENYLPDSVLMAWAAIPDHTAARPAIAALLRLSAEQRDHVHMATPDKSPWDPAKPKAVALFQTPSVSSTDRDLLAQANLKGRGDSMLILALRDHHAALSASDLNARDHQGDLKALVRSIEDEL